MFIYDTNCIISLYSKIKNIFFVPNGVKYVSLNMSVKKEKQKKKKGCQPVLSKSDKDIYIQAPLRGKEKSF